MKKESPPIKGGFFLFQDHLSGDPQIMNISLVVIKVIANAIAEDRKTI